MLDIHKPLKIIVVASNLKVEYWLSVDNQSYQWHPFFGVSCNVSRKSLSAFMSGEWPAITCGNWRICQNLNWMCQTVWRIWVAVAKPCNDTSGNRPSIRDRKYFYWLDTMRQNDLRPSAGRSWKVWSCRVEEPCFMGCLDQISFDL